MKTALCLHGYFDGKALSRSGGSEVAFNASEYIHEKIIDNNTDVFIHTWDVDNSEIIKELYNPVQIIIEKQNEFIEEQKLFDSSFFGTSPVGNTLFRGLSFHFSRKASINLVPDDYDRVVVARFDLGQRGKEHIPAGPYFATNFNFSEEYNPEYLYSAYWNQLNHGYADHWFYSGVENMRTVGSIYDRMFEYYQPTSEYVKSVTESGWFDSDTSDEFSNQMFEENTNQTKLMTYPRWACIDNHKLYKWHFKQTGLYEKSRFVDIAEW
jgi:hypothetical protein